MRTFAAAAILLTTTSLFAADPPAPSAEGNPISAHSRHMYDVGVRALVTRAAELTPEEHYAFRPVETVRTFGEILAHIADTQYFFCSVALGEPRPSKRASGTATKAELLDALDGAFDYCARAHTSLDDMTGAATVRLMGSDTPKLGVLSINTTHTIEHYGNLVTYMRMKGLVPPTSDPEFMKTLRR